MLKELLTTIFGVYEPVTQELTDGTIEVVSGAAGVDWVYLASVFLFSICLYCLFRILGGIMK